MTKSVENVNRLTLNRAAVNNFQIRLEPGILNRIQFSVSTPLPASSKALSRVGIVGQNAFAFLRAWPSIT